jgi:hypothetical protein
MRTENLGGVQPLEPLRPADELVARDTAVGILEGEQNVDGIAHTLFRDEVGSEASTMQLDNS